MKFWMLAEEKKYEKCVRMKVLDRAKILSDFHIQTDELVMATDRTS